MCAITGGTVQLVRNVFLRSGFRQRAGARPTHERLTHSHAAATVMCPRSGFYFRLMTLAKEAQAGLSIRALRPPTLSRSLLTVFIFHGSHAETRETHGDTRSTHTAQLLHSFN